MTDYELFLKEINITQKQMDDLVESDAIVSMPNGYENIEVKGSNIEGKGLFTTRHISRGELICPVRCGSKRTIAGRYSNHALHANTIPVESKGMFYIRATQDIQVDEEITMNYRDVVKFRINQGDL